MAWSQRHAFVPNSRSGDAFGIQALSSAEEFGELRRRPGLSEGADHGMAPQSGSAGPKLISGIDLGGCDCSAVQLGSDDEAKRERGERQGRRAGRSEEKATQRLSSQPLRLMLAQQETSKVFGNVGCSKTLRLSCRRGLVPNLMVVPNEVGKPMLLVAC